MSIVERLAAKWGRYELGGENPEIARNDARWWLNTIADELEAHGEPESICRSAADWLRESAQDDLPTSDATGTP